MAGVMLVTVQSFGVQAAGGGARILRALLSDPPMPVLSVATWPTPPSPTTVLPERHLPIRPHFGRVESTRFEPLVWQCLPVFVGGFQQRLEALLTENKAQCVHAVSHGVDFWYSYQAARKLGKRFVLTCHDELDYNLRGRPDLAQATARLGQVWADADARCVISEPMGEEYCRRWGKRPYALVTDGLSSVPSAPKPPRERQMLVYFAGALHLSYQPNFQALAAALEQFAKAQPDWSVKLIVRGSPPPIQTTIAVEALPWGTEAEVAADLTRVDALYLPLPFDAQSQSLSRFSLSTKMVTYLGSGLPILYHGPVDAAAGALLAQHGAAIQVTSLEPERICRSLLEQVPSADATVRAALELGRSQFLLDEQRRRFWSAVAPH